MRKDMGKKFTQVLVLGVIFFTLLGSQHAQAKELLWQFKVPVKLKNMPPEVKYVVLWWGIAEELKTIYEDRIFEELEWVEHETFEKEFEIKVYDTDVGDPSKPTSAMFFLELSQDGVTSYPPDKAGQPWTKSKPGTKPTTMVVVTDLQGNPKPKVWS